MKDKEMKGPALLMLLIAGALLTVVVLAATGNWAEASTTTSPISPPPEPEAWELEWEETKKAQRDQDMANDPEEGAMPVRVEDLEPTPTIEPYRDTEEWCVVTIPLMGRGIMRCEEAKQLWPTGQ